jgi:hypothetical protein
VIRGIVTFVVSFFLLAFLFGLFGWLGPVEVLLLLVIAALLAVGADWLLAFRRPAR